MASALIILSTAARLFWESEGTPYLPRRVKARAIKNAIRMARDVCSERLDEVVAETLSKMNLKEQE